MPKSLGFLKHFFFLEPPYFGKYRYRKNLTVQDHLDLREMLGKVKGKWLLTYNDHPKIRELYKDFDFQRVMKWKTASLVKSGQHRKNLLTSSLQIMNSIDELILDNVGNCSLTIKNQMNPVWKCLVFYYFSGAQSKKNKIENPSWFSPERNSSEI